MPSLVDDGKKMLDLILLNLAVNELDESLLKGFK